MKKAALSIILSGCLLYPLSAQPGKGGEDVKIFTTLAEAVPRRGRPVLLVFFSLKCHVCWGELFEMKHFIQTNDISIDLIGISCDPAEELRPFLNKYAFTSPVVSDRARAVYRRFRVRLEPFRVILDGDRVIYMDDTAEDFFVRRDRAKKCLLEIASR